MESVTLDNMYGPVVPTTVRMPMSYTYHILIDAPVPLETLSLLLRDVCALTARQADHGDSVALERAGMFCYIQQPVAEHQTAIRHSFRFTPTWLVEIGFERTPTNDPATRSDPHPQLVALMRQIFNEYECNLAWLTEGRRPVMLKLHRKVTIQDTTPDPDFWQSYLNQVARELGFPFDVARLPEPAVCFVSWRELSP